MPEKEPYLKIVPVLSGFSFWAHTPIYRNHYCTNEQEYLEAIELAKFREDPEGYIKEAELKAETNFKDKLAKSTYLSELDPNLEISIEQIRAFLKKYEYGLNPCADRDDYRLVKLQED